MPADFFAIHSGIGPRAGQPPLVFRPIPPLCFRTHVPNADDTSTEQALAARAGARCRGNGTRVRDAGRGNAGSQGHDGSAYPAGSGPSRAASRPHRRAPAPPTAHSSATQAQERHGPPPRAGLPHAGPSPGEQAGLIRPKAPGLGGRERPTAWRPPRGAGLHRLSGRPLAGRPESLGRDQPRGAARAAGEDSVVKAARNDNEPPRGGSSDQETGGDLLSQALASQVPSALWGLTALFGMGRGVSPTR